MTVGPGHGGPMQMMRSFSRDPAVGDKKLAPGTRRRIARFAAPYKRDLIIFIGLVIVDSVVGVASPLIGVRIIDDGIGKNPPRTAHEGLIVTLALVMVGLALFDAGLALVQRWYSA